MQQQAQLGTEFFRHQEAVQAQSLNRSVRLNNLRNEIANIQARITSTRISHPPGTVDMNSLMAAEQDLKQKLFEATYMNYQYREYLKMRDEVMIMIFVNFMKQLFIT